jgi:hypothetical protein
MLTCRQAPAFARPVCVTNHNSLEEAAALNERLRRPLEATKDYEEGIQAHFEKRPAVFRGE